MKTRRILLFMLVLTSCLGLATPVAAYDSGTLGKYTSVSCGATFIAAIDTNGTLWMWGSNDSGELGNGGVGNDK